MEKVEEEGESEGEGGEHDGWSDGLDVCWRPVLLYKCVLDSMSRVQYYW